MEELPFLLKLLDDPSPRVRDKVTARLRQLGPDVWREIEVRGIELSLEIRFALRAVVAPTEGIAGAPHRSEPSLPDDWLAWLELPTEDARLEAAWELLSNWQFQHLDEPALDLGAILDDLAGDFIAATDERTATALVRYLADEVGLRGALPDDYYNPLNSNIVWAAREKRGLPITLAGVYILVGARLGISLWGCNFPGHFLVGANEEGGERFFDPFNGGYEFEAAEINALRRAAPEAVQGAAIAQDIIGRVLRNLAVAYQHQGDLEDARFVYDLLSRLEAAIQE